MNSFLLAALFGSLVIQLVSSQGSRTTWAANQSPGLGPMTPPPLDFTEYQNNMAIAQINAAPTENQAAYAAAAVYSPVLDMSDAVQSALETKVQHLRTPANWQHHVPPPLPFNFDPMYLVLGAFYKTLNRNAPQVKATGFGPAASPPMGMGPAMGPDPAAIGPGPAAMGPPTSIRRGGRPGPPGNARRNRNSGSARWRIRGQGQRGLGQNAFNNAGTSGASGSWGNRNNAGSQGETGMAGVTDASPNVQDFTPPASVTPGWTNPAINANPNPTWWT